MALPPIAILLFLLGSCQPNDTYEAYYDKCFAEKNPPIRLYLYP